MGANCEVYKVKCKQNELLETYEALQKDQAYEHGHGGYSGTCYEAASGLIIETDKVFDNIFEAEEYIFNNTQKWEKSMAVPLNHEKTIWLIGGHYSC